jgi:hypothetical protein
MGSKGIKRRKPARHLAKVGTPEERQQAIRQQQRDVFGAGGGRIIGVAVAVLFALAILAFVLWGVVR